LAEFNGPEILRLDTSGNLYVSDYQNFRIRKINANTGIITTIAGIGASGYNGDEIPATSAKFVPSDFVFDKAGNIYVSDYNGRRVRKIDASGIIHTIAGNGTVGSSGDGGPATAAQLNPKGLAIDNIGNLFIADPYANVVRMIKMPSTN
jgi:sugar lactone lactonase YvrE